jgi:uncharacterized membrane protein
MARASSDSVLLHACMSYIHLYKNQVSPSDVHNLHSFHIFHCLYFSFEVFFLVHLAQGSVSHQ